MHGVRPILFSPPEVALLHGEPELWVCLLTICNISLIIEIIFLHYFGSSFFGSYQWPI